MTQCTLYTLCKLEETQTLLCILYFITRNGYEKVVVAYGGESSLFFFSVIT